ncbi:SipW-dependent-type signal peptide-containing protein [Paenarthrobacter sp. AR 02]|uniref:SipW-dependent-type signal peptide-containing protein n=1 Tax=Paenarthrobacter sp. AR 02 TaxID=2899821 RepID=UPI001F3F5458|nr:SipW-dependent-type signal peptide-containing protein [Paenarthrobacter sp. AR 02]MCF3137762.1 SipW-dependent-type signal peptide-containing protein [Paenarthrobacter sp. AR 02]
MTTRTSFLRTLVIAAVVALGLIAAPTAAFAAFTDVERATPQYTAASLAVPAAANVTMTCSFGIRATVTVNSFSTVANANYHDIKIFDRSGNLEFTGDLSKAAGKTYTSGYEVIGTWTYEIRGYYKVPGSTNTWTGKVLKGSLSC